MLFIEREYLINIAEEYCHQFRSGKPFSHVVIDNFLPQEMAELFLKEFPEPSEMDDSTYQKYENKIALSPHNPECPHQIEDTLHTFSSSKFIAFLETITSIDGLIPDPHFIGAGLQQTMNGGKLGIHVDFNLHKGLGLYRRLNVLIYLNKDWKDEYGGHFELWDINTNSCVEKILPIFNRCVIFETSSFSLHGLPDPIQVPDGVSRKSIVLYYYTSNQGLQEKEAHWTRHLKRPNSVGDNLIRPVEQFLYKLTPPIIIPFIREVSSKLQNTLKNSK